MPSLPTHVEQALRECGAHDWLTRQLPVGARLELLDQGSSKWLGDRLVWYPQGCPDGRRIGLASSRLGRRLDTQQTWFTVFRAACSKADLDDDVLLTAHSTTTARFVARAAELFNVRVLSIVSPRERESLASWLDRIRRLEEDPTALYSAYLSPSICETGVAETCLRSVSESPLRDRAVVALSDRLLVFHLRRGGHLEHLVRARLLDDRGPQADVFIALGEDLVERELADELLDLGAIGWLVLDTLGQKLTTGSTQLFTAAAAPIVSMPDADNWLFLTHCTRAQAGGWPDQGEAAFLDELIVDGPQTDRSAFAALQRIVAQQRLVATSQTIRGDQAVVSFTAVPLREVSRLRVYRSHLGRWDFEPYGICVARNWLESRGARPVRYGGDRLWESMAKDDRPFFQKQASRDGETNVIDWTIENEWRHVGDVNLRELPSDAGLVFVPTSEEAEQLARLSRWPVAVLRST
jgi:hypothetical protein